MTITFALVASLVLAAGASAAGQRATGTLNLSGTFSSTWRFGDYCDTGTPAGVQCVRFVGTAEVAGLGRATVTYTKRVDDPTCTDQPVLQFRTAVLEVANKGSIHLAMAGPVCGPTAPAEAALTGTISGGEGLYAGASGSVQFKSSVFGGDFGCGPCGLASDRWTGTLTVPALEFDTVAPVLSGAVSRTVRVPRAAKGARAQFSVKAQDAVDGPVATLCAPRSGSLFRVGRSRVTCSATDSSGNTGRASFVVTVVKRKR
jgi:HYR domain